MNYETEATDDFEREAKKLLKKYHSFSDDLKQFKKELLQNPLMGDDLGNNTRKVRMAIAAKNRGKSGGARVITFNVLINIENTKIYLLTIYDKGQQDTISKQEIQQLKLKNGLT